MNERFFVNDIIGHACAVFGASADVITGRSRRRTHVNVRNAVSYLARELTPLSLPQIGKLTGGRDHSTVMHGISTAKARMALSPDYRARVAEVEARVKNQPYTAWQLSEMRKALCEQAEELAEIAAAEKAAREHYNRMAGGNKATAAVLQKRAERVAAIPTSVKPKNNFKPDSDADDAHEFHAIMAENSATLRDAILKAKGE